MTDCDRVLSFLRGAYREHGLAAPDVIDSPLDGGKPILRLAARIKDLRTDGYPIVNVGRRNRCAIYKLAQLPGVPGEPAAGGDKGSASLRPTAATDTGQERQTPAAPEPASLFDDLEQRAA